MDIFKKMMEIDVAVLCPEGDERVIEWAKEHEVLYHEGHPDDLLTRYVEAAKHFDSDMIIRLTGDCPMVPTDTIGHCIKILTEVDYCSNTVFRSYPEGMDVQGCSKEALEWFDHNQETSREHPFISFDHNSLVRTEFIEANYTWKPLINVENVIFQKLSIDTPEDLKRVEEYIASAREK